jgi:hypothetical protein
MNLPGNWIKALGMAISFPSMIFSTGWLSLKLHEASLLSKKQAVILFLALTSSFLLLLVVHGIKKKN